MGKKARHLTWLKRDGEGIKRKNCKCERDRFEKLKKDEDVNGEGKNRGKQRSEARSECDPCHLLTV